MFYKARACILLQNAAEDAFFNAYNFNIQRWNGKQMESSDALRQT